MERCRADSAGHEGGLHFGGPRFGGGNSCFMCRQSDDHNFGEKVRKMEMTLRTKVLLVNGSIAAELLFEIYRGRSLHIVGISAVFLFAVANLGLYRWFKRQTSR